MQKFVTTMVFAAMFIFTGASVFAQPVNVTFLQSRPIYESGLIYNDDNTGVSASETDSPSASCTFSTPDNDGDNAVWFWFAPSSDGDVTIDLDGSGFDTIVTILNMDLEEVACNDDDPDNPSGDFTSRIENEPVVAGGIYFIRITGFQGAEGVVALAFDGPVTTPGEDANALRMPNPGVYPITTRNATPGGKVGDDSEASCAPGTNSVFRFFEGTGGPVTLDFALGGFDTVMSIIDISGSELACNDDGGEGTLSMISDFPTEEGVLYIVRVVGFNGAEGDAQVRIVPGTATANEDSTVPEVVALDAAYPNPFAVQTTLPYVLPEAQEVRVVAYDVLGREVAVLAEGVRAAGQHEAIFDAAGLPSGIYIVRLTAGKTTITRRVTVVR